MRILCIWSLLLRCREEETSRYRYGFALATSRCTHFWYRPIPSIKRVERKLKKENEE